MRVKSGRKLQNGGEVVEKKEERECMESGT